VVLYKLYRDTDLLKQEVKHEKKLAPNMTAAQLGPVLRIFNFNVTETTNGVLHFKEGTYDQNSGLQNIAPWNGILG
jgi:hypothetical protein